jgi:hypothetical protein
MPTQLPVGFLRADFQAEALDQARVVYCPLPASGTILA